MGLPKIHFVHREDNGTLGDKHPFDFFVSIVAKRFRHSQLPPAHLCGRGNHVYIAINCWFSFVIDRRLREVVSMEGVPADIGDWDLKRVFREGGNLLWKHFGDFLPVIVVFIIPASVTKVLRTQGSTDPKSRSSWTRLSLDALLDFASQILFLAGWAVMYEVLKARVYVSEYKIERQTQSFFTSVRLTFTRRKPNPETDAFYKDKFPTTSEGKILKAFGALIVCYLLFVLISTTGCMFTPEDIAAMGLPRRTIFLFTLLITLITALITSYFQLVGVVGWYWLCSPRTPILA